MRPGARSRVRVHTESSEGTHHMPPFAPGLLGMWCEYLIQCFRPNVLSTHMTDTAELYSDRPAVPVDLFVRKWLRLKKTICRWTYAFPPSRCPVSIYHGSGSQLIHSREWKLLICAHCSSALPLAFSSSPTFSSILKILIRSFPHHIIPTATLISFASILRYSPPYTL